MSQCPVGGEEEHAVAVAEEAHLLRNGLAVGGHCVFVAGEAADEHNESGLGEVEIGEEPVGDLRGHWRVEEDACAPGAGAHETSVRDGARLDRPDGGSSHAEDLASRPMGVIDGFGRLFGERVAFLVHHVFLDGRGLYGLEGPCPDVECQPRNPNALGFQLRENLPRQV